MLFSVVITTRNRPALLRRALASVSQQTCEGFEVVVVDDGSLPGFAAEHAALAQELGRGGRFHHLPPSPGGMGPSFARNHGVAAAAAPYVAFLDDDDEWIEPGYLAAAARSLAAHPGTDLHYANQVAVRADGSTIDQVVWIEDLAELLPKLLPRQPDGTFAVTAAHLLQSRGFCHLNATIVRRQFFQDQGGFDASLRYEEDRDFHLRGIDAASAILYSPAVVARHHVPDRNTASTSLSPDQRSLDQLRVLDKAILRSSRPEIRAYAKRHKGYTLKAIAQRQALHGDHDLARFYAGEALGIGLNTKWLAYVGWLWLKRGRARTTPSSP